MEKIIVVPVWLLRYFIAKGLTVVVKLVAVAVTARSEDVPIAESSCPVEMLIVAEYNDLIPGHFTRR